MWTCCWVGQEVWWHGKVKVLNTVPSSVFTSRTGLQKSRGPETRKGWSTEDVLLVEEDQARKYLSTLDIHESMHPDGMHSWVLRVLAHVIARTLSIIFEESWGLEEVPEGCGKANVTPIFKKGKKEDPRNYDEITGLVEEGRVADTVHLDFSKAFDIFSPKILVENLMK